MTVQDHLDLVDWRRQVGNAYRTGSLQAWRSARERLLREHPQSPIPAPERVAFAGLRWFPPDPAYRVRARLDEAEGESFEFDTGGPDGVIRSRRIGRLGFQLHGLPCSLAVFWLAGYAGGLFLPFRDRTSGVETYGGGRYLADTAKNTDAGCLEMHPGSSEVTIDFNWAYHPSCYYSPRWACPLAPAENWLPVPVRAGERT